MYRSGSIELENKVHDKLVFYRFSMSVAGSWMNENTDGEDLFIIAIGPKGEKSCIRWITHKD